LPTTHAADRERIRLLAARGVAVAVGRGTPFQLAVSWSALGAAVALLPWLGARNPAIFWVLPVVLVAMDFLSGVVHWLFDTRIPPGEGTLGRAAVNFLDHHVQPARTAEVGFAASAWRVALGVSLPLLLTALWLPAGVPQAVAYWLGALALVVAQAHKQAHRRRPGRLVRVLQQLRLALPPGAHREHHRDHGRAYCVFTGWCNPLLDGAGFWRWLERRCGGSPAAPTRSPISGS
jgi:hypothetical protein